MKKNKIETDYMLKVSGCYLLQLERCDFLKKKRSNVSKKLAPMFTEVVRFTIVRDFYETYDL